MSFRSRATLQVFGLGNMGACWRQPACHNWAKKDIPVLKEISRFSEVFSFSSPLLLSHITMPIAESLCHSSTTCQHFTDSYRQGELQGGKGRNACRRQRKGRGGRGGVLWDESKCYDAAQMKRKCQNETLSVLVTDIFRQFQRLNLDKWGIV